nr:fimbria/pilus periplasmic chaperone [Providencia stuartii]
MKKITLTVFLFFLSFFTYSAGLSLNKTRIIFNEGDKSASVTFKNNVGSPFLVQNEIYDVDNKKSDFLLLHLIFLELKKTQPLWCVFFLHH